jgi:hypothetical protein
MTCENDENICDLKYNDTLLHMAIFWINTLEKVVLIYVHQLQLNVYGQLIFMVVVVVVVVVRLMVING